MVWWQIALLVIVFGLVQLFIYDKYVQRKSSLLINYPVLARMRYVFELLREPLRQYFAEETFYESRDKVEWVYKAAKDRNLFLSFSVAQPFSGSRFIIKNANRVLNTEEVSEDFSQTFGKECQIPYVSPSVIVRSAMSDGALSPEATRSFAMGALKGKFPVNTGEGGLTSNYFFTHRPTSERLAYLESLEGTALQKGLYRLVKKLFNGAIASRLYRKLALAGTKAKDSFILDTDSLLLYRINWSAPLEVFPKTVPEDIPDIVLQIGSGLYGVRKEDHSFDPQRYEKVMRFCKMTEVKIAQGAKQTGGKIISEKVTDDIAYYRGVEAGKDLMSPNRFPYANTLEELLAFVATLKEISKKPVGIKIVISDVEQLDDLMVAIKGRKGAGGAIPDFITVDGGDGGSATAPLELMESVGLSLINSLYLLDFYLRMHQLRNKIKIIGSGKILTPDDVAIALCMGADMVGIARGFMMSGGCIRARHCSGAEGKKCPVGMATQDRKKRLSYLVLQKSHHIANYHRQLLQGLRTILAVTGEAHISKLSRKHLAFRDVRGELFFDVDTYFQNKLHV